MLPTLVFTGARGELSCGFRKLSDHLEALAEGLRGGGASAGFLRDL